MSDSPTDDKMGTGDSGPNKAEDSGSQLANDQGAPNQGADSSAADSPAAGADDKGPASIMDAVRGALAKDGKEQSSGSGGGEDDDESKSSAPDSKGKSKEDQDEEELGELTEEELNSYKPKTKRRVKQLLQEIDTLKTTYQPTVQRMEKINNFVREAGLTNEDVNTGFEVMRLMKKDPVQAYEKLKPIMDSLEALVGERLPKDLQEQVDKGQITEQHAKELSRSRSELAITRRTRENDDARREEEDHSRQVKDLSDKVSSAVSNWEQTWKGQDPDYRVKHSRVMQGIKLALYEAMQEGKLPRSTAEAVSLCDKVKKGVDEEMRKLRPPKRETVNSNPSSQNSGPVGNSTGSKPAPKSVYEAVAQAVGH